MIRICLGENGLSEPQQKVVKKWLELSTSDDLTGNQSVDYWLRRPQLRSLNMPQIKHVLCCIITANNNLSAEARPGLMHLHSNELKKIVASKVQLPSESELKSRRHLDSGSDTLGKRPPCHHTMLGTSFCERVKNPAQHGEITTDELHLSLITYATEFYCQVSAYQLIPEIRMTSKEQALRLVSHYGAFATFASKTLGEDHPTNISLPDVPSREILRPKRESDETQPTQHQSKRTKVSPPVLPEEQSNPVLHPTLPEDNPSLPEERLDIKNALIQNGYNPLGPDPDSAFISTVQTLYPVLDQNELGDVTGLQPTELLKLCEKPLDFHNYTMASRVRNTKDENGFGNGANATNLQHKQEVQLSNEASEPEFDAAQIIATMATSELHTMTFLDAQDNPVTSGFPKTEDQCLKTAIDGNRRIVTATIHSSLRFSRIAGDPQFAPCATQILSQKGLTLQVPETAPRSQQTPDFAILGVLPRDSMDRMHNAVREHLRTEGIQPSQIIVTEKTVPVPDSESSAYMMEVSVGSEAAAVDALATIPRSDNPLGTSRFPGINFVRADDRPAIETALPAQSAFESSIHEVVLTGWPSVDPFRLKAVIEQNGDNDMIEGQTCADEFIQGPLGRVSGPIVPVSRVLFSAQDPSTVRLLTKQPVALAKLLHGQWMKHILGGAYGNPEQFKQLRIRFPDETSIPIDEIQQLALDGIVDEPTIASYEKAENSALKKKLLDLESSQSSLSDQVSRLCEQLTQQNALQRETNELRAMLEARNATISELTSAPQLNQVPAGAPFCSQESEQQDTGPPSGQDSDGKKPAALSPPPGSPAFRFRASNLQRQIDALGDSNKLNESAWSEASEMYKESEDEEAEGLNVSALAGAPEDWEGLQEPVVEPKSDLVNEPKSDLANEDITKATNPPSVPAMWPVLPPEKISNTPKDLPPNDESSPLAEDKTRTNNDSQNAAPLCPDDTTAHESPHDSLKGPATLLKTANPPAPSSRTPRMKTAHNPGLAPQDDFQTPNEVETRAGKKDRLERRRETNDDAKN